MRFKDIRFHIFIAFLLIVFYIFFAGFYFVTIEGIVKASAISQAETFLSAKIVVAETNIEYYKSQLLSNKNDGSIIFVIEPNDDFTKTFTEEAFVTSLSEVSNSTSKELRLFLNVDGRLAYVSLDKVFTDYNQDETYYYFNSLGEIVWTNNSRAVNQTIGTFFSIPKDQFGTYKNQVDDGFLICDNFYGYYFAYHVNKFGSTLGTGKLQEQTLIFYTGAFIVLVVSFFILLFGFKKASRLLLIDKHNYNKAKSIVIRVNKRGKVVFVNKVFKALFNYEVKLEHINELETVEDNGIIDSIRKEMNFIAIYRYNNENYYLNLAAIYSKGSYYLIGFDDTKQYINNQYLLQMLSKNNLTGLDNSLSLTANFMEVLEMAKEEYVSMALINIQGFREINKVFGRRIGDQTLIAFSELLISNFEGMKVYHMDADNFCAIIHHPTERLAQQLCNNLMLTLKTPLLVKNNHISIRAKMGIYHIDLENNPNITMEEVRNKMEISMKRAMNTATKDIVVYDFNTETYVNERNKMEQDLLNALDRNEFEMYFQPQYDIFANRIVSFEALIRWNNPLYFRQSPQVFIEMAEHNGFILEIGKFVIQESFKVAKKLEPYGCHVSINVSPAQLLQAGFVTDIINEFNKNNLKPGSIAIEITETFVMENFDVMLEKIDSLKRQGFSIHLDDFGTGYSSLLYLKSIPTDVLKIDKEFTKHIETDKHSLTLVEHICNIGRDLGLDIICEGVETQKQSDILKKLGCRIIQGWLIGKATPIDKAIELIHKLNIEAPAAKKQSRKKAN